MTVLATTTKNP